MQLIHQNRLYFRCEKLPEKRFSAFVSQRIVAASRNLLYHKTGYKKDSGAAAVFRNEVLTGSCLLPERFSARQDRPAYYRNFAFFDAVTAVFVSGSRLVDKSKALPKMTAFRAGLWHNTRKQNHVLVNGKSGGKGFGISLVLFGLLIIAIAFTKR